MPGYHNEGFTQTISRKLGAKRDRGDLPGLFALAMGKMGAFELNYSSDIDLIVFYEPELVRLRLGVEPLVGDHVARYGDAFNARADCGHEMSH
jgi:hypothetical protein